VALPPDVIELKRLEIWDTAIKIGLGAAIAAVATLVALCLAHRHDRRKERTRRRQDALERIEADFNKAVMIDIESVSYFAAAADANAQKKAGVTQECMRMFGERMEKWPESATTVHGVEGRLLLLGMTAAADAVEAYRMENTKVRKLCRTNPFPPPEVVAKSMQSAFAARVKAYSALSREYWLR
jgi:hypothetical protein